METMLYRRFVLVAFVVALAGVAVVQGLQKHGRQMTAHPSALVPEGAATQQGAPCRQDHCMNAGLAIVHTA